VDGREAFTLRGLRGEEVADPSRNRDVRNMPAGVVDLMSGFGAIVTFCQGCTRVDAFNASQVLAE
jgi:hypothetical protein